MTSSVRRASRTFLSDATSRPTSSRRSVAASSVASVAPVMYDGVSTTIASYSSRAIARSAATRSSVTSSASSGRSGAGSRSIPEAWWMV